MTLFTDNYDIIILIIIGIIIIYYYYYNNYNNNNYIIQHFEQNNNKLLNNSLTFEKLIKKNIITLYYSPNCGHCVEFLPEWKKLQNVKSINNIVVIETINCSENYNKCKEHNVQAYPTIIMQKTDGSQLEYNGNRTVDSLINFINTANNQ